MVGIARGQRDSGRGQRLDEALRSRNVSKMYVLAIEIGVNESAISRWRRGQPITTDHLIKLCQALDISADWLLLGRGNMDQHGGFSMTNEEKALLLLVRSLPADFLTYFTRSLEAITAK